MARTLMTIVLGALLGACATQKPADLRQYSCDDGTGFSADVSEHAVVILGPVGSVELPRDRRADERLYTNNLRTVILDNGYARYRLGRRDWTTCRHMEIRPFEP